MVKTNEYQSPTGAYRYDFSDAEDYRKFVQIFGGEAQLKKYPQIQKAVVKTANVYAASKQNAYGNHASQNILEGSIAEIRAVGENNGKPNTLSISSKDMTENVQEEIYGFYRLSTEVEISYANATNTNTPVMTSSEDEAEEEDSMTYCLVVNVKDDSAGTIIYQTKLYYENEPMRLLEEVSTSMFPYQKLAGKCFTMTVDALCEAKDGTLAAVSLAPRKFDFRQATAQSFIKKITVTDPRWQNGKKQGSIVFLYGRSSYGAVKGDYVGGNYLKNVKLRTIIPITGIIELNPIKKITKVSIDSYVGSHGTFPKSYLDYPVSSGKVIAEHGGNIKLEDLGKTLQGQGSLNYDSTSNKVSFDLKLPVKASMLGPYDWDYPLNSALLNNSSHTCYLNGCFVLRIEHEKYMGTTVDQYAIYIYSVPGNQGQSIVYYESGKGETNVFIPPIEIYWGCFAKDTLIKTADGSLKRADQIKTGDQITALGGKTLTVADTLTGEDPEIIRIMTKDGKRIRVSGGHAMLLADAKSPSGIRAAANQLQAGDKLMTPDGVSVISEVASEPYNDTVYNFVFEGEENPNYIEADGFWSGDFYAQNAKKDKKPAKLTEEAMALRDELRKFAEE